MRFHIPVMPFTFLVGSTLTLVELNDASLFVILKIISEI